MTTDERIIDQKFWCNLNIVSPKTVSLSYKYDKYEYLDGKNIPPPDQNILIKQGKFYYLLL